MIARPSRDRAANCAGVAPCLLGATTGTDREVESAVGESFVVMFEEQFASREHYSTVPCPTRAVATRGMAGVAIRFARGTVMTRAG
jgi:hypothetical protein